MSEKGPFIYPALNVECAGWRLGIHSMLSIGACMVTKRPLTLEKMCDMNLAFYAELAPTSLEYDEAATRVGCLHLECIEEKKRWDSRYDATSHSFEPRLVLEYMQEVCLSPKYAAQRFDGWIDDRRWDAFEIVKPQVMPIIDALFGEPGHINYWLAEHLTESPLGYRGHNLKDLWRGYRRDMRASLKELGVPPPEKPHHALHDAYELAQQARIVLFEKGLAR